MERDIDALTRSWTDRDSQRHPGLFMCVRVHQLPVHMVTMEHHGKHGPGGSAIPWDDETASWWTDVSSGARRHERALQRAAFGHTAERGTSDRSTIKALWGISTCAQYLAERGEHLDLVAEVAGDGEHRWSGIVARWMRDALLILGAERSWKTITWREDDGTQLKARCPYCRQVLRVQPDLVDYGDPERWTVGTLADHEQDPPHIVCPNRYCLYENGDDQGGRRTWPLTPRVGELLRTAALEDLARVVRANGTHP